MTNPRDNQVAKALRIADVIDPNRQSRDYGEDVKQWRQERAMKGHKKNYDPWSDTSNIYTYPTEERHDPKDPMYYISPEEYKKGLYDRDVYALARGGRAHMAVGGDPTIPTTEPTGALTDPTANYVRSLYQNVMGRQADDAGINYWADQINQGNLSPADVLQQFAGSKEFQGVYQADPSKAVNALYQTALGRAPDQAGLDYWTQQAKGGMDLGQMVSGFTGSEEGQPLSVNWSDYLQKAFPDQSREGEYQVAGGWQSQATPVPSSSQDLQNYLGELETKYNLPSGLLLPMMGIESQYGTNQKKAGNPHYGAFQLSNDLIKQFKVKNPYDWKENANAAAQYALENKNRYADMFGREPTPAEYYNMHQQGFHGYTKLRAALDKNPNAPAAKVAPTRAAILNNMPSTLGKNRNPTAREWLNAWEQKFNQMAAGPDQQGVQAVASYYQQYPRVQTAGGTAGSGASSQDPALALAADKAAWQKNRDAYINDRISKGLSATLPPELTNYTPGAGGTMTSAPATQAYPTQGGISPIVQQGAGGNVYGSTSAGLPTFAAPSTVIPSGIPDSQGLSVPSWGDPSVSAYNQQALNDWALYNIYGGPSGTSTGGAQWTGAPGTGGYGATGGGSPGSVGFGGTGVGQGNFGVSPMFSKGGAVNDALRLARANGGGAWTRKEGKNPKGGLNEKGRASLRAQGHDIKRPQPEGGARKDSFCRRMHGLKEKLTSSETANDPNSRINKSLRVWNCHSAGGAVDNALKIAKYPERKKKDWVISHDYEDRGGKMKEMSPDEFLDRTRPLHMDDATKASVSSYKSHMKRGDRMDPLQLLANGMEDGRHRATAAKELGIDKVPVIDFRADGGPIWDKPRPKSLGKPDPLTSKEKSKAKRMAKSAGRPYPNLVDNMRASRAEGGELEADVSYAPDLPMMARDPNAEIADAMRVASEDNPKVKYDTGPEAGEAVMRPYEPTLKERIYQTVAGTEQRPSPERAQFARGVSELSEFTPVVGNVMAAQEAQRRGDTKGMLMAALPVPGMATEARMAKAATDPVQTALRTAYERRVNPTGLYSHAAEAAYNLPQAKGSYEQMMAMLKKAGVKPEELHWSGAEKFAGQPVTREQLVSHFEQNVPKIEETVLGISHKYPYRTHDEWEQAIEAAERRGNYDEAERINRAWEGIDEATGSASRAAKFQQYTIPGGENYREVLLHTPGQKQDLYKQISQARDDRIAAVREHGSVLKYDDPALEQERLQKIREATKRENDLRNQLENIPPEFTSSHWDQPNVLGHLRLSDRTGPQGEKILHMEELQSDWGQAGRKKGFALGKGQLPEGYTVEEIPKRQYPGGPQTGVEYAVFDPTKTQVGLYASTREEAINSAIGGQYGVPRAPYVEKTQNWVDLGLKRALKEAAEKGYDKLVWTPGAEQAARYKLSKHIDGLSWSPDTNQLIGFKDGVAEFVKDVPKEDLHKFIGEGAAEKLMQTEPYMLNNRAFHHLEGQEMDVGGEGMKSFYDSIIPSRLKELMKKIDPQAKVELGGHSVGSEKYQVVASDGTIVGDYPNTALANAVSENWPGTTVKKDPGIKAHSIQITPKMREAILKGLPAYAKGGAVETALSIAKGRR